MTLALLAANGRALTWQEVQDVLDPLSAYVATRGLPTTRSVQLPGSAGLLDALVELTGSGLVTRYAGGTEPVYSIGPDKHLEAAFYRNTLVHFFVTRAIVELALVTAAQTGSGDLEELTWAESLRLRDVLKFEFFFPRKEVFAEQVRAEVELVDPAWKHRERSGQQILGVLRQARPLFAPLVLRPFLEAYSVVAGQLAAQPPGVPVQERELLAECGRVARQRVLQLQLQSPESNSRELFRGCLQLAANRGLLDAGTAAGTQEVRKGRAAFAAELAADVRRCRAVAALAVDATDPTDPTEPTDRPVL